MSHTLSRPHLAGSEQPQGQLSHTAHHKGNH